MKRFFLLCVCIPIMLCGQPEEQDPQEYQLTDLQYLDPVLRQQIIAILLQQAHERRERSQQDPYSPTAQRRTQEQEPKKPRDTEAIIQATTSILSKVALTILTENSSGLHDVLTGAIVGMVKRRENEQEQKPKVPQPQRRQAPKKPASQPSKKTTNQPNKK